MAQEKVRSPYGCRKFEGIIFSPEKAGRSPTSFYTPTLEAFVRLRNRWHNGSLVPAKSCSCPIFFIEPVLCRYSTFH